jgi:hypothetical protein
MTRETLGTSLALVGLSLALLACQKAPASDAPDSLPGANIKIKNTTLAPDMPIEDFQCSLDKTNVLAGAVVLGAIAQKSADLKSCASAPQSARVFFRFESDKVYDLKVADAHSAADARCIAKTFQSAKVAGRGECLGTFILGNPPAEGGPTRP